MQIYENIQDDGTFDLSIEMNHDDIDGLINALNRLKEENHFHIVNNFNGNKNKLCDIEIYYNATAQNDFEVPPPSVIHYPKAQYPCE